jgi:hypothetical protein
MISLYDYSRVISVALPLRVYKAGDTNTEPRQGDTGGDINTEPRQGDTGGVSNVPDDTSSMAKEPPQVEEQDTESRDNSGSDQNKRPRLQVSLLCVLQEKLLQIEYVICQLP